MSRTSNRDMQRATFIESLHSSLKKQASKALSDHKKMITIAETYIKDGLEDEECIELLMIDGLSREAAESYTSAAVSQNNIPENENPEYSFQFEDEHGRVLSSYDVGKTIYASNDDEAWEKAEEALNSCDLESQKLISVNRIS